MAGWEAASKCGRHRRESSEEDPASPPPPEGPGVACNIVWLASREQRD